jgi:ParB family chromosome partitioning protein
MTAKQALGRGLKALIPDTPQARAGLTEVALQHLHPNPQQPRRRFDEDALRELSDSIARHGLLQPLVVSETGRDHYVIVAGERRWRAARLAGLKTVPVVIRERLADSEQLELALVENLQRRDLTPLEEARAFDHLRSSLGLSQGEIADRVGMDRSSVANSLRLLRLEEEIQELVEAGRLSAGHGRTLLAFADRAERLDWARRAAAEGLSVRVLEQAAHAARPAEKKARPRQRASKDPNLVAAENKLSLRLGARVEIRSRKHGGQIVVDCSDQEDLMRIFDLLMGGE